MMSSSWRLRVKRLIPPTLLNYALLRAPVLYRTALVNYETNMGPSELADLHEILPEVVRAHGDLIECGSSRCGSAVITALWLKKHGHNRRIFACDSFEGFRPDEFEKQKQSGLVTDADNAFTSTNYKYVLRKLQVLGLNGMIIPIKGYFQDTLEGIPDPFCYALIDCDLEESMEYCARTLFPKLSPGGWMVFDDYFSQRFKGARHAVDRFVLDYQPQIELSEPRRSFYVIRKQRDTAAG
jgi:O-methyltransferase